MPSPSDTRRPLATLRATVLGSGSSGNALAVQWGAETLLLDCGFSAREVERRLAAAGIDPGTLGAVIVSHEHTDHIRGVRILASRRGLPVYTSRGTRVASGLDREVPEVQTIASGKTFTIGSISVTAFRTSHDAAEPLGFRFEAPCGTALGVMTDTGTVTEEARDALRGCDALAIESNHDARMLEDGPYPWFLKRRIASAEGHLSNDAAACLLAELASDRLQRVVGLHLSSTNNTARLAAASLTSALARLGHPAVVAAARQETACALMV